MYDVKSVVIVLAAVGVVMIACLAATTLLAPRTDPVIMLGVMGVILIAVLALALGRGFMVRFNLDKSGSASGQLESAPNPQTPSSPARRQSNRQNVRSVGQPGLTATDQTVSAAPSSRAPAGS